jgi:hypothetical protein
MFSISVFHIAFEGRSSKDVGLITDMSPISVNHWVNGMEKTQERMAESGRLSRKGQTLLRS